MLTCIGLLERLRALSSFNPFKCPTSRMSTICEIEQMKEYEDVFIHVVHSCEFIFNLLDD